MKFKNLRLLAALLAVSALPVFSEENIIADVNKVGVLGDGVVFIEFPVVLGSATCRQYQVRLDPNHVAKKEILAVALAAYSSGQKLNVMPAGCYGAYPSLIGGGWMHAVK